MSPDDPVEVLSQNAQAVLAFVGNDPSLNLAIRAQLAKVLVLAAASAFEFELLGCLRTVFCRHLNPELEQFVANAALERRYHTYFDWEKQNANKFFAFFGPEKAGELKQLFSEDVGMRDFMRLGRLRNELVHGNFAAFSLDMTLDEVMLHYRSGRSFLDALQNQLG